MVDLSRLELPTSRLSGVRSNLLSYRSIYKIKMAGVTGLEPATSGFGDRRSTN